MAFLAGRVTDRDRLVPRTTLAVLGFAVALLLVYLAGFFNLETNQALSLYGKGMTKFAIHFAFLAAGVAYLARRSERFYWQTLGWFAAGFAANAAYGLLQVVARLGGPRSRRARPEPDHRGRSVAEHLGRGRRVERVSGERPDR